MILDIVYDHKHPHWIDNADSWICSNCGYETNYLKETCPQCKEKMKNVKEVSKETK